MNKVDFEIQAPLFSAGSDPNAELRREGIRPPSIRWVLRFWFRAVMGEDIATGRVGGESCGY